MSTSNLKPKRGRPPKEVDAHSLGGKIRTARERLGYTTVQLAEMIGVSNPTITDTETGKTNPSKRTLLLLAQELGTYFDEQEIKESIESWLTRMQRIWNLRPIKQGGKELQVLNTELNSQAPHGRMMPGHIEDSAKESKEATRKQIKSRQG